MPYDVTWGRDALAQLATAWTEAPDRAAIAAASLRMDRRLAPPK